MHDTSMPTPPPTQADILVLATAAVSPLHPERHAMQEGDRMSKHIFYVVYGKSVNERPNVGGVSMRSRNGAPSRKGCVVNGQMTKASNK